MEDQTKDEEAKRHAELARTPNAAKSDKNRRAGKQIDSQRLYEAIQHLKKHPKRP